MSTAPQYICDDHINMADIVFIYAQPMHIQFLF
jgi:hypothetical protein